MAFEVLEACGGRSRIPRGRVSVSARGMGRFNLADLKAIGVGTRATILIDREQLRLAIRAPLECESGQLVGEEGVGPCRAIWLGGALREIGVDPKLAHGWHVCPLVEDRIEVRLELGKRRKAAG